MLFDQYKKMLDRRALRYGLDDQQLRDSIHEVEHLTTHMDFGNLGSFDASEFNGTPLHPDEFFLPFEDIAAEVQLDLSGGLGGRMMLLIARPDGNPEANLVDTEWPIMLAMVTKERPGCVIIYKASIQLHRRNEAEEGNDSYKCAAFSHCIYEINSGRCIYSWCADPSVQSEHMKTEAEHEHEFTMVIKLSTTLLRLIETANSPANWVVEVKDEHARVVKRGGEKVRERRSRYIVVPDRDLDRVLRIPNEGGEKIDRSPHRRRAHWRRLNSPRFRLKRGQRVLVRETWIGPKDALHGNERYTVLTSLASRAS